MTKVVCPYCDRWVPLTTTWFAYNHDEKGNIDHRTYGKLCEGSRRFMEPTEDDPE